MGDLDQGAAADALAPNGHPGTVRPLNPKEIAAMFATAREARERVEALKRWRAYSDALMGG